jgi:hypothetical protein
MSAFGYAPQGGTADVHRILPQQIAKRTEL